MIVVRRQWATLALPLLLAACTAGGEQPEPPDDETPTETSISVAVDASPATYNVGSSASDAADRAALNQVLRSFTVVGPGGTLVPDRDFGTYEKVSDDPLVVEYTIDSDAVWSDGEPIDCDDVLLDWAAHSGAFGEDLFDAEGSAGYDLVAKPECDDGDRSFTYTYRDTFADWQSLPGPFMPAHVAERAAGVEDVVAAVTDHDVASLEAVAAFWDLGWARGVASTDLAGTPSSGPFVLSQWEQGRVVLTANPRWWGTPPAVSRLELLAIAPEDRAQALLDGTVHVAELPPAADVVDEVTSDDGLVVERGPSFGLAQLRFSSSGSVGTMRSTFADCVPRQRAVAEQVAPLLVDAEMAQSRFYFPFQPQYEDVVTEVRDPRFDAVRIDQVRADLQARGRLGTHVRLAFDASDPRLAGTARAIIESCGEAGFEVVDVGDAGLGGGSADVALVVDEGGPLVSRALDGYRTDGEDNTGGYTDAEVDALASELLATPDPLAQIELVKQLDALLWDDLATLPLYVVPVVVAHDATMSGVSVQPSDVGVTWNADTWTASPS